MIVNIDEEFECAKQIMKIVEERLNMKPSLDTCLVQRLCEMMLRTEYPMDEGVPMTATGAVRERRR